MQFGPGHCVGGVDERWGGYDNDVEGGEEGSERREESAVVSYFLKRCPPEHDGSSVGSDRGWGNCLRTFELKYIELARRTMTFGELLSATPVSPLRLAYSVRVVPMILSPSSMTLAKQVQKGDVYMIVRCSWVCRLTVLNSFPIPGPCACTNVDYSQFLGSVLLCKDGDERQVRVSDGWCRR